MRRRLSYANVAATLALVFSMTGGAFAAQHYLINSTKQINPSVIKKLKGKTGKTGATGKPGTAGTAGAAGAPGAPGAPATALWARVGPTGALDSGSGVASTAKLFTGGYEVIFNRSVNNCAYLANVGSASVSPTNESFDETGIGYAVVEPRFAKPSGVFVETEDFKGEPENKAFHLAVFC
ncbi:MAG: hypothetical protein QOK19_367 [Solirubrobacteraceae bacterium]|nr:hypothetical protein [Solirubrobacteraceae bacterium]